MLPLILVLLLIAVLFGLGFLVKALFWVALIVLIIWLIGFVVGRGRWYSW